MQTSHIKAQGQNQTRNLAFTVVTEVTVLTDICECNIIFNDLRNKYVPI